MRRKFGLFVAPAVGCAMILAAPTEAGIDFFPFALSPGASIFGGGTFNSSDDYLWDDGTGETNLAWSAADGGELIALNQFNVLDGLGTLTGISVAWGTGVGASPAMLLVFSDPNNDGSPVDITVADLLYFQEIFTEPGPTDDFLKYDVGSVPLGAVGDSFFIGIWTSTPPGDFPARIDLTAPQGHSWVAGGPLGTTDPFNPNDAALPLSNLTGFGFNGNFMIRGNAIPVPGALALLGVAGLIGVRRRRR